MSLPGDAVERREFRINATRRATHIYTARNQTESMEFRLRVTPDSFPNEPGWGPVTSRQGPDRVDERRAVTNENFFAFAGYHQLMAGAGAIVILAFWLPRLLSREEPTAPPLMILLGATASLALPTFSNPLDPRLTPKVWEIVSELAVIIALFGAGMRIDRLGPLEKWWPTIRLLAIAMPLTIATTALMGTLLSGLTFAGALLLGAVLAPTDPVLAADVQVGPPHEGRENAVRFTLTTEAGLNDGLAFPFVYLAIAVALQGPEPGAWLAHWLTVDLIYRIGVGVLMGWVGARLLGHVLFSVPRGALLADTGSGVIALAGIMLCYGTTELAEGYGFIAVAVLGMRLRRIEEGHRYHGRLHDFSAALEEALTALLLVALGTTLPALFQALSIGEIALAILFLLLVRPLSGLIALLGSGMTASERGVTALYGVRGIGSIYYLSYAQSHVDFLNEDLLWAIVALVILLSTVFHGFTVPWAMRKVEGDP